MPIQDGLRIKNKRYIKITIIIINTIKKFQIKFR